MIENEINPSLKIISHNEIGISSGQSIATKLVCCFTSNLDPIQVPTVHQQQVSLKHHQLRKIQYYINNHLLWALQQKHLYHQHPYYQQVHHHISLILWQQQLQQRNLFYNIQPLSRKIRCHQHRRLPVVIRRRNNNKISFHHKQNKSPDKHRLVIIMIQQWAPLQVNRCHHQ